MSNLSALERETIANYNQQETEACVFTYDTVLQRKLDKLCAERPDEIKVNNSRLKSRACGDAS